MKVKCIHYNTKTKKHFFLLMIAPILIGLFITITSLAHAEWNQKDDPLLLQAPKKQGWVLMGTPSKLLRSHKEPLKTASR